jgi:hypothetical protein
LVIEGDNARLPGLHHADGDPRSKSHFIETPDEMRVPVDFQDTPGLSGAQQVEWNDV